MNSRNSNDNITLDPGKTALLIVDMMNRFCDPEWLGHNDGSGKVEWYRRELAGVIPAAQRTLGTFREAGALVVHVVNARWTDDGRDVVPYQRGRDYDLFDSEAMSPTSDLAPIPGEIIIRKVASSAFQATGLDFMLRNAGIENVAITGQYGDCCCFYSLIMSREAGFRNYWVTDALLYSNQEHKTLFEPLVGKMWATLTTSETLRLATRKARSSTRAKG